MDEDVAGLISLLTFFNPSLSLIDQPARRANTGVRTIDLATLSGGARRRARERGGGGGVLVWLVVLVVLPLAALVCWSAAVGCIGCCWYDS